MRCSGFSPNDSAVGIPRLLVGIFLFFLVSYGLERALDLSLTGLEVRWEDASATSRGMKVSFRIRYGLEISRGWRPFYDLDFPVAIPPQGCMLDEETSVKADGIPLQISRSESGFSFLLPASGIGPNVLEVAYSMNCPDRKATYLTQNARNWPHLPDTARFLLGEGMSSNYECNSRGESVFTGTFPETDWEIEWKDGPGENG